jgi:hypothetical protein
MGELGEVIDEKFDEALGMMLEKGNDSVLTANTIIGSAHEIIGLDCEIGQPNRYILSRPCIDGHSVGFDFGDTETGEIDGTSWMVQIPRTLGDKRRIEDLPVEAMHGDIFLIDSEKEVILQLEMLKPLAKTAIKAITFELSGLRVAEDMTNFLKITEFPEV